MGPRAGLDGRKISSPPGFDRSALSRTRNVQDKCSIANQNIHLTANEVFFFRNAHCLWIKWKNTAGSDRQLMEIRRIRFTCQ